MKISDENYPNEWIEIELSQHVPNLYNITIEDEEHCQSISFYPEQLTELRDGINELLGET